MKKTTQSKLPTLFYPDILSPLIHFLQLFFKDFIYLFVFRQRGREGESEGEKHQCACLSCNPYWGPGPQPRHVP